MTLMISEGSINTSKWNWYHFLPLFMTFAGTARRKLFSPFWFTLELSPFLLNRFFFFYKYIGKMQSTGSSHPLLVKQTRTFWKIDQLYCLVCKKSTFMVYFPLLFPQSYSLLKIKKARENVATQQIKRNISLLTHYCNGLIQWYFI